MQTTRAWLWVGGSLVLALALGAFVMRPRGAAPAAEVVGQAGGQGLAAGHEEEQRKVDPPPADESMPKLELTEAQLKTLLGGVSADPRLSGWLAQGDLLRRWAVALDNLADGQLPRRDFGFLAPGEPFAAVQSGGRLVIDPRSWHRWDALATAIHSVNAREFAKVVRTVHGPLQAAWRALGYPGRSVDGRAAEALGRIAEAPVPRDPPEVEPAGKLFVFVDPELEQLPPVEKLLLRMGPHNARLISAKAREVARELGYATVSARR